MKVRHGEGRWNALSRRPRVSKAGESVQNCRVGLKTIPRASHNSLLASKYSFAIFTILTRSGICQVQQKLVQLALAFSGRGTLRGLHSDQSPATKNRFQVTPLALVGQLETPNTPDTIRSLGKTNLREMVGATSKCRST